MRSWLVGPAVAASLGLGAAIGAGAVAWSANDPPRIQSAPSEDTFRQLELFADVLAKVQTDYVTEPKDEELIEAAINGMLASLDPHSSYMDAESFRDMQVQTKGQYGGLGIEVTAEDGVVKVISPIDDTPASRAGIKSGDRFVAIDGQSIVGLPLSEAVKKMRGPVGTAIRITILREGTEEPFEVSLTRETIEVRAVTHRVEAGDIGYIRISTFNETTGDKTEAALRDLRRQLGGRMKGIVLDLRNNGGGLLDQAIEVSDLFMDGGEVVSTRGRDPADIDRYNARRGEMAPGVPVVVLINQGSASASEIVAGALQDRGRATVVGMDSFGKGSVQTVLPLRGGALRLTTAKYYTPAGRSIQATGIEPDIEVSAVRVTKEDIEKAALVFRGEEDLPHALGNEEGARRRAPHLPDDMPPADWKEGEDYQLKRAVDVLRGTAPVQRSAEAAPRTVAAAPATTTTRD
jgi:carboxyl-terminal processing protease